MARARRPQQHVGRSEYQLHMPYPGQTTPEGIMANMREIERWGNALPLQRSSNFVPYYLMYTPSTPETDWDVTLTEMMQETYDTDLVPMGTWFYGVEIQSIAPSVGTTGMRSTLNMFLTGQALQRQTYVGYWLSEAIRVVKDIDFVTPAIEYEWVLPDLYDVGVQTTASAYGFTTVGKDGGMTIQGNTEYCWITDPTAGPEISHDYMPSIISAFAYRISDSYESPFLVENITPP